MRTLLVIATLLAAGTAAAEPSQTETWEPACYVEAGIAIGGTKPAGLNMLASLEGGYRLVSSPLWIHGEVIGGTTGDDRGRGHASEGRAGLEARACVLPTLCGIAGVDLGAEHVTWFGRHGAGSESLDAFVVIPRAELDLGGDRVRVRLGAELSRALFGRHRSNFGNGDMETSVSDWVAGELTLSMAYQW